MLTRVLFLLWKSSSFCGSPLPFVVGTAQTCEHIDKGTNQHQPKVWISQPASGLDKRQCTLQVCCKPTGEQPRLAVIFHGTGKRVSEDEKAAYQQNIDVYWRENAWTDTQMSVEWVKKTLASSVKDEDRFVLFCVNLKVQVSDKFRLRVCFASQWPCLVWTPQCHRLTQVMQES